MVAGQHTHRVPVGRSGNEDVWVTSVAGEEPTRLTLGPDDERPSSWSADGRSILFTRETNGTNDVWVLHLQ